MTVKELVSGIKYLLDETEIAVLCTLPDRSESECVIDRIYIQDERFPNSGEQKVIIEIHDKRCEEQDEE